MASVQSGHARAAMIMHAARRSLFVARVEKYEAKMRQGQKAKAVLREGNDAVVEENEAAVALVKKPDPNTPEKSILLSCQLEHEGGDSPDQKEITTEPQVLTEEEIHFSKLSHGLEAMLKSAQDLSISGPQLDNDAWPADANNLLQPVDASVALRPTSTMEVDIVTISAALKVRLKAADMIISMQDHAFRCARNCLDSMDKFQCKRVAYCLKKEFDKTYGPAWHCIVGTRFGSFVTHSVGGFVYFSVDKVFVLLFKTTVEPIEQ